MLYRLCFSCIWHVLSNFLLHLPIECVSRCAGLSLRTPPDGYLRHVRRLVPHFQSLRTSPQGYIILTFWAVAPGSESRFPEYMAFSKLLFSQNNYFTSCIPLFSHLCAKDSGEGLFIYKKPQTGWSSVCGFLRKESSYLID